ncbi:hypothetical protein OBBRIDRAFT_887768 [Obba rivulosa]|uniref:Uncharacterized protein n=1 Tax=Obba rivulosa TaxID=1052685 RepID=A0A8E2DLX3_9APHY|nr:hypothetical protein OBBRIDRAFT_887768 [Obba rivulosa]
MVKSADEREHARAAGTLVHARRRRHREDNFEDEDDRGRGRERRDERRDGRNARSRSRAVDTSMNARHAGPRPDETQTLDEDDGERGGEAKEARGKGGKERAGQRSAEPRAEERPQSRGILANVLSAVSREVRSFVVTATTGNPPPPPEPQAPPPSTKKARRSISRLRTESSRHDHSPLVKKRAWVADGDLSASDSGGESAGSTSHRREVVRKRRPTHDATADDSRDFVEGSSSMRVKRARNADPEEAQDPHSHRSHSSTPEPASEHENRSPSPTPPPSSPPLPTPFRKPITMPGSFFPRSSSLQPSEPPSPEEITRRVRFIRPGEDPNAAGANQRKSRTRSKLREEVVTIPEDDGDDVQPDAVADQNVADGPTSATSRERSRERSTNGAGTMPPIDAAPSTDFSVEYTSAQMSEKARGKQRAAAHDPDTSSELRVWGKESELRAAREAHARILTTADEEERERDKLRIKLLEEEVERLRTQLAAAKARRGTPAQSGGLPQAPPPPPPPPLPAPPTFAVPKLPGPGARPLSSGGTRDTTSFLQSARAHLKPTVPPVEAPINTGPRTRKTGQPTVNVPTDKMAAFLTEVKNVRLRKISAGEKALGASVGSGTSLTRSSSDPSRSRFAYGERSFDAGAVRYGEHSFNAGTARIGEKRKRTELRDDTGVEGPERTKRRFSGLTVSELSRPNSGSSHTAAGSATASNSSNSSQDSQGSASSGPFAFSRDYRQARAWPSVATTETDLTTPSLCSDHEHDGTHGPVGERSHEQGTEGESQDSLHTPPALDIPQARSGPMREIIDVDAEPYLELSQRATHVPEIDLRAKQAEKRHEGAFACRKPTSPMPTDTPRKPLPPARARRVKEVPAASDSRREQSEEQAAQNMRRPPRKSLARHTEAPGSESDDPLVSYSPLPLTQPPPKHSDRTKSASQKPRTSKGAERKEDSQHMAEADGASTSNAVRRRRTLDEELQRAGDALWVEPDSGAVNGEAHAVLESGQLVGVGTKSKRKGFLAGGGASGIPVFMGAGYVRGAEEDGDDHRQQGHLQPRRSKSRNGR